jgi:hypothetical protein
VVTGGRATVLLREVSYEGAVPIRRPSTCAGAAVSATELEWRDGGVTRTVIGTDVDREHVLAVVASLRRP